LDGADPHHLPPSRSRHRLGTRSGESVPLVTHRAPRILVLSMYPLDEARSGPTVRITRLIDELRTRAEVEIVAGYRSARRVALARYAASGRLHAIDGIYVESSTALPGETDIAFLGLARGLGRPVLTYVRDAYQLFSDYYPIDSAKRWVSARAFPLAMLALRAVSSRLAFPSRGLAEAVLGDLAGDALLLPPGAPEPVLVPRRADATSLLLVGDMRGPAQGAETLLTAIGLAREAGANVDLLCVTRPGGEPRGPHPDWLRIERASSFEIPRLLPGVLATVIARSPGAYNDLALPIKLMEYLAYGRPLLVTDRRETAALVRAAGCGVVVGDGAEAMAAGIAELVSAPPERLDGWSTAAHDAARHHAWGRRADRILLELTSGR